MAVKATNTRTLDEFRVISSVYHRNGITGVGFHALNIIWQEPEMGELEAVVTVNHDDVKAYKAGRRVNPDTRALMIRDGGVNIELTMRGDWFHEPLVKWLIAKEMLEHPGAGAELDLDDLRGRSVGLGLGLGLGDVV